MKRAENREVLEAYKTDVVVEEDGTVTINNLPFRKGEKLEVILLQRAGRTNLLGPYPLRGEPVRYVDPFENVAEDDWKASN